MNYSEIRGNFLFFKPSDEKQKNMEKSELLYRITMNPEILFGKPSIRNMRYPVSMILDLLSAGMTNEEILADYPDLELEDIQACLAFAARLANVESITKIKAA